MASTPLSPQGQPVTRQLSLARNATRDANELTGLARGILADGALNQLEAEFVLRWLEERPESVGVWPFNVLFQRFADALQDGHLDADEEKELVGLLMDFIGGGITEQGITTAASTLPLCQPAPAVEFEDAIFCLTGSFASGTRRECEQEIVARGGISKSGVTKKTRYLVIGNVGSTDWANTTYGRKIEKGVALRGDGVPISIISEKHWADALR